MEHEKKVSFQLLVLITTPKLAEHAAEMFKKGALPLQYRDQKQSLPRNLCVHSRRLDHADRQAYARYAPPDRQGRYAVYRRSLHLSLIHI